MTFVRHEVAPPADGDVPDGSVLLRFRVGGVCGSDIGRCLDGGTAAVPGPIGLSLHEIVGDVVASQSAISTGSRVVGWVGGSLGLAEMVITEAEALAHVTAGVDDVDAVSVQPLACVLHALTRFPDLSGANVAVIGLGPIGLLFGHPLKDRGATTVTGIDLVDRTHVATQFGFDRVELAISRTWAAANQSRFDVVIEAVGHQVGTLQDAIVAVKPGGTILYFGNPDNRYYPVDFGSMMDKGVILHTGRTPQAMRGQALVRAQEYITRYPGLMASYVTHVLPVADAQRAYELAAVPRSDRLKVVLDGR